MMSCSGIAFGLVNQAKTATLKDGDAYLAWTNLCARYAPHEFSDYISLSGDFNRCRLETTRTDPETWFIKPETLRNQMQMIDVKFTKSEEEIVAHIIDRLPKEYSEVVTVVEGMQNVNLQELKGKIRAFHKRRFKKDVKVKDEIALYARRKVQRFMSQLWKTRLQIGRLTIEDKHSWPNKYAGHVAKDCPKEKKIKKSGETKEKETGMFVGMVEEVCSNDAWNIIDDSHTKENHENENQSDGLTSSLVFRLKSSKMRIRKIM